MKREEIVKTLSELRGELDVIDAKNKKAANKKLIGKCFKYRNSYSCPVNALDYWYLYNVVIAVDKDGNTVTLKFETDKNGKFEVEFKTNYGFSSIGNECKFDEVLTEWNKQSSRAVGMFNEVLAVVKK